MSEINLREEFDELMECRGHWAALRHRADDRHTTDLDPSTEEGGDLDNAASAHKTIDTFIKIRKRTLFARGEKPSPLGKIGEPLLMFYMKSAVRPAKHDYLLELVQEEQADGSAAPAVPYKIARKYDILDVDDMRDFGGRVEFFQVYVQEIALGDVY